MLSRLWPRRRRLAALKNGISFEIRRALPIFSGNPANLRAAAEAGLQIRRFRDTSCFTVRDRGMASGRVYHFVGGMARLCARGYNIASRHSCDRRDS